MSLPRERTSWELRPGEDKTPAEEDRIPAEDKIEGMLASHRIRNLHPPKPKTKLAKTTPVLLEDLV